jgi:hypothetical protein
MFEARPTLALDRQVAEEHANRGKDHPQGAAPVVPVARLYEIPDTVGCVRLWITAKNANEIPDILFIRDQRSVDDPPIDLHPPKKLLDQFNPLGTRLHAGYDSPLPQILGEPSDTPKHLGGTVL